MTLVAPAVAPAAAESLEVLLLEELRAESLVEVLLEAFPAALSSL